MKIVNLFNCADENPCDGDGQWKVYSFNRRHSNYKDPDYFFDTTMGEDNRWQHVPKTIGLRRKLEVGTAFILSYYEHGACSWSLAGTGPQCRWDSTSFAGLLVWEHPVKEMGAKTYADREKDAEGFLEIYTKWCNGEVYGFMVTNVKTLPCGHTEEEDGDSIGGFYDTKDMASEIRPYLEGDKEVQFRGEAAWLGEYLHLVEKKKKVKSEDQPAV